jgi:hypothetical protein
VTEQALGQEGHTVRVEGLEIEEYVLHATPRTAAGQSSQV